MSSGGVSGTAAPGHGCAAASPIGGGAAGVGCSLGATGPPRFTGHRRGSECHGQGCGAVVVTVSERGSLSGGMPGRGGGTVSSAGSAGAPGLSSTGPANDTIDVDNDNEEDADYEDNAFSWDDDNEDPEGAGTPPN